MISFIKHRSIGFTWAAFGTIYALLITFKIWDWTIVWYLLCSCTYVYLYFFGATKKRGEAIYYFAILIGFGIYTYAMIYTEFGIIDTLTQEKINSFQSSLYFSIVTWTTLGYGDFRPSPEARFYAASEAMFGYLYTAIFVAKLFHYLSIARQSKEVEK